MNSNSPITVDIKLEHDKSAQSVPQSSTSRGYRLTSSFLTRFHDEYVHIEYAVDALFEDVNPDRSRMWCQCLILADLSPALAVQRHRETYICKKSCVDDINWNLWWQNLIEHSDEASELSFGSDGSTLVDDEKEEEGSNDGSVGSQD